jgi:hypothetical protein
LLVNPDPLAGVLSNLVEKDQKQQFGLFYRSQKRANVKDNQLAWLYLFCIAPQKQ